MALTGFSLPQPYSKGKTMGSNRESDRFHLLLKRRANVMIYVYGSRLFGKVDVVPGMFHVQTKFGHFNYIPLIPMQSYVVLSHSGKTFRGVPVPLSAKSVFMCWGRLIAGAAAIIGGIIALINFNNPYSGTDWHIAAAVALLGAVLAGLLFFYKGLTRASFNRACQLGRHVGLSERGFAEIQRIYGESSGRGFDVIPAAQTSPGYSQPVAQPVVAQPAAPSQGTTFWLRGVQRSSGQEVCVPVIAIDGRQAREMGLGQGIDVATVQYQDGSLA
jgi:hypothetical protein